MAETRQIVSGQTLYRTVNGESVKIHTTFVKPPIPASLNCDWSAITDEYEPSHPQGQGATEEAALADLIMQLESV